MLLTIFLMVAVGFVAVTNGANANFKGVASLYGSGTATLRQALVWGTLATFAGSVVALFLAEGMIKTFSGKGLVDDSLAVSPLFVASVASGAALTSFFATRLGFPVSTTHALVGSLVGAGLAGGGYAIRWEAIGKNFLFPLLFSPLSAALLGAIAYWSLRGMKLLPEGRSRSLDRLHFLTAGLASFARGLNDTPKMAALLITIPDFDANWAILGVGLMIAVGGLVDGRNVAETLGKKVTGMNPSQGFAANLVTSLLVTTASWHSLPVSTTHVSVGALTGMGISTRQAKRRMVVLILVAWITTVPCGAITAMLTYRACDAIASSK